MSSLRCPRCGRTFDPPARYCTQDGTPLGAPVFGTRDTPRRTGHTPSRLGAAATAARLADRILGGRYVVESRVGEGGMAYVYRATDRRDGRTVAIKVLVGRLSRDTESNARFLREAELAGRLNHPNVCPLVDQGETQGMRWLVMPFLEGETLDVLERRDGMVPVPRGIRILRELCAGLQHAHDLGILHRDLKPENVMLVPRPEGGERAVVMDFGLAKEQEAGPDLARLTATGIVLGTPEFMSPEQVRGKPLDARSDVFALGVLAFEMFSGRLPFEGESAQETMMNHLTGTPLRLRAALPDCPPLLDAAIARALAQRPEERFPSMRHFAAALETIGATSEP